MKCQLIQSTKVNDANKGEKEFLDFLRNLPEDTYVYRELQVAVINSVRDVKKKKPDFVVVSPWAGVVSIETKDWDIISNKYEWRDQYNILVHRPDGSIDEIENPSAQADAYFYALSKLMPRSQICVSSLIAFPRVSRTDFLNRVENLNIFKNPQSRFYLDLNRVIFKEEIDEFWVHPERMIKKILANNPLYHECTQHDVEEANRILMPPSFVVGDFKNREVNKRRLRVLTDQQQKWIFNLDPNKNYLLDVAGSGKTNALISKAIFLVDKAGQGNIPRILLTTYSHNLEINIRNIFIHKISDAPDKNRYLDFITICCIPDLIEQMVVGYLNIDPQIYREQASHGDPSLYEASLKKDLEDILKVEPERFRRFDYIFIDEIQDFDNFYLTVASRLCRKKNFFLVGDIGQKIYDRSFDLERLGFISEIAELSKSYKMFRTPRYIAELSTNFILGDRETKQELADHGYDESFQYPNPLENLATMRRSKQPEKDCVEGIGQYLRGGYAGDDILVICSEERLKSVTEALASENLPFEIGETSVSDRISVVDFMHVKGLEKEIIFVIGIEDLYDRSKTAGLFDSKDEEERVRQERFSRRKVYVSLTRTIEYLTIYYYDPNNRFIQELLAINQKLIDKKQRGLDVLQIRK